MSDAQSHDLETFEAMVPVIIEAVPQEDILAAVTCYIGPIVSRSEDPTGIRSVLDEIPRRNGGGTLGR